MLQQIDPKLFLVNQRPYDQLHVNRLRLPIVIYMFWKLGLFYLEFLNIEEGILKQITKIRYKKYVHIEELCGN